MSCTAAPPLAATASSAVGQQVLNLVAPVPHTASCVLHLAQRVLLKSVTAMRNARYLFYSAPAVHKAGHASLSRRKRLEGFLDDAVGK